MRVRRAQRRATLAVVGDDDQRRPLVAVQLDEQVHDVVAGVGVEGAGRLIRQHDGRRPDQGAGDGHALLLSAGQLVRLVMGALSHADPLERPAGAAVHLRAARPAVGQRQAHVLKRGEAGQQVEGLEHEADARVADGRAPAVGHA